MTVTYEMLEALSEAIERHEASLRRETDRYWTARQASGPLLCTHLDRIVRMRMRRHDALCRLWLKMREEFRQHEDLVTRALLEEAEQAVRMRLREYELPVQEDLPF